MSRAVTVVTMVGLAAALLAYGVVAWRGGSAAMGVLVVVVALLALATPVVPVVRGLPPETVDLSPDAIRTHHVGRRVEVRWEDVVGCTLTRTATSGGLLRPKLPTMTPGLRPGAQRTVTAGAWPLWRRATGGEDVETVWLRDLPVPPEVLVQVVSSCLEDPSLRQQLGTEESCGWATSPPVR